MAISPCPETDVNPRPIAIGQWTGESSADPPAATADTTRRPAAGRAQLPVNDAPFEMMLYNDPQTGQRRRSRLVAELNQIRFESCAPIRTFPAYRGRRSHQGRYWFSRSQSHVRFESRFEMTALMVLDFQGNATAVSSNPFWLLWPHGTTPARHVPDFFVRRRDGSVLIVDVKPAERITDKDRVQHDRTRVICSELGWDYNEFTMMDVVVERNLRLLSGYRHPRFAPPGELGTLIAAQVHAAGKHGLGLPELVDAATRSAELADERVLCAVYHMLWNGQIRVNLNDPLTWNAAVRE
ncbi:TnsA-like heteromeric transposase endonuclease subunit [Mycolicibacterium fortuitum]|uniref:TnsA-like heteromeric transposase endonuclease subunit n=1 Tax=Mycolicibacterium fortuitum TaxID=1766 RepID=UPI00148F7F6D|nr:TnsA-like heteromeric transposase endonuclease subunit [Mycolicibacterium fortuitum]